MKLFQTPKSIADYYDDLGRAVEEVRNTIAHADDDAGFKRAADIIEQLVPLCRELETVAAINAEGINNERYELMKQIGTGGIIDVTGEASKLLASKYNVLSQRSVDKYYWPKESPKLFYFTGPSFDSKYAEGFDRRKKKMEAGIAELQARIDAYDNAKRPAVGL